MLRDFSKDPHMDGGPVFVAMARWLYSRATDGDLRKVLGGDMYLGDVKAVN